MNSPPLSRPKAMLFASLSVWSVVWITVFFLVVIGCVFYFQGKSVMESFIRQQLQSTAAIAALEFSGEDIEKLQGPSSLDTPLFRSTVQHLIAIRSEVPSVRFAYILRRTADPQHLSFVADADSLKSPQELDLNRNGIVDASEQPSYPNDLYSITNIPALQDRAFEEPTTDVAVTTDQWGQTFSGYAPIKTSSGRTVAVLGIDIAADDYRAAQQRLFSTQSLLLLLIGTMFIGLFILLRLTRNRSESLQHLNDERSWLLQLILHQVGTPLTMFKWGIESLRQISARLIGTDQAEAEESVKIVEEGITRLQHVTDVLLAADRIQEGTMIVHSEWIPLHSVIEDILPSVQPNLEKRRQKLVIDVSEALEVRIDRKLLAGVIRELIDNAIIYAPTDGHIDISAERHKSLVRIRVKDNGAGIPMEDIARIFERFSRGRNAAHFDPNGTGIGLYIARGIIERFGGHIAISSTEGKGTTVTVEVPGR